MYDAMDRLALECEVSFTCLGKGNEFVLIDNSAPSDAYQLAIAREKGFCYCGVLGLNDGVPRVESEADAESRFTMLQAGLTFCRIMADKLRHPEHGDSVQWLRQLHALPDARGR